MDKTKESISSRENQSSFSSKIINMNNIRTILSFIFGISLTTMFAQSEIQSKLLPISSGEAINFNNPTSPVIQLPMDPTLRNAAHDESTLWNNICFKDYFDQGLYSNTVDDGTSNISTNYYGQHPMFCQAVAHDKNGNILFHIVDNNIYNRNGESFEITDPDQEALYKYISYGENHYWLHQGIPTNTDLNGDLYYCADYQRICGEQLNRGYITNSSTIPTENRIALGPELIIVPVPNACNEFFLIYSTYRIITISPSTSSGINIFYRKLKYFDQRTIEMTPPVRINSYKPVLCYQNFRMDMAISEYRPDEGNYLLFLNTGLLEILPVSNAGPQTNDMIEVQYGFFQNSSGYDGFNICEMELVKKNNEYLLALGVSATDPYFNIIRFPYDFDNIKPVTTSHGLPNVSLNYIPDYAGNWWHITAPNSESGRPIGLEFSADADKLFFTFESQNAMYYADLTQFMIS